VRVEAQVISLDHVLAQVNADVLRSSTTQGVGYCSRSACIVKDSDLLLARGAVAGCRWVEEINADPADIADDETSDFLE